MKILEKILNKLKPSVEPFERKNFTRKVRDSEKKILPSIQLTSSILPEIIKVFTQTEILEFIEQASIVGKYLWVIDEENGLRIIEENTPNPNFDLKAKKIVCHTNITGGEKALQGGEMWFCSNGVLYFNYWSGRYGAVTELQKQGVIEYFEYLGFKPALLL
jgi:hypothetical protein